MRGLDGVSYKLQGSVLDARGSHKPEDRGGSGDCNKKYLPDNFSLNCAERLRHRFYIPRIRRFESYIQH